MTAVSEELANTPTICAKSYVHQTVVAAFENGKLEKFSETLKRRRSPAHREQLLAQVVATWRRNAPLIVRCPRSEASKDGRHVRRFVASRRMRRGASP